MIAVSIRDRSLVLAAKLHGRDPVAVKTWPHIIPFLPFAAITMAQLTLRDSLLACTCIDCTIKGQMISQLGPRLTYCEFQDVFNGQASREQTRARELLVGDSLPRIQLQYARPAATGDLDCVQA